VAESQELGLPYLYDPSQQIVRLTGDDLQRGVEGAYALFVNEYEFCLIEKHTGLSLNQITDRVEILVITKGEQGSIIINDGKEIEVPVVPPQNIVDPTGVGDAFRGGFLTGLSYQLDLQICGEMGSLAAAYCLETDSPQSHTYTPETYIERFRKHFDDDGALDVLIK
jgi:adenosine kinase